MNTDDILNKITEYYLKSRDFNGISLEDLYKTSSLLENKFKEVMIRRIYLPAGIEGSLALNAFPTKKEFFINLEKIVKETRKKMNTKELPISHNLEIKAYPKENYQYFALNIFRFIDRDDIPINRKDNFYKKIEKVNSKLKKNPIKIKMKPCIVISDPYLANDKPQIDC
jgi:hypothetical protein